MLPSSSCKIPNDGLDKLIVCTWFDDILFLEGCNSVVLKFSVVIISLLGSTKELSCEETSWEWSPIFQCDFQQNESV